MITSKKLLLWDIDGTLVTTGGAGLEALSYAMKKEFGVEYKAVDGDKDVAGRTDRYIGGALLKRYGIEPTDENVHRFLESYLTQLPQELQVREGGVHTGIREILEIAHQREDLVQALLTGNLHKGAKIKLTHYEIFHFFEFGAYADDAILRDDLGPFALARAKEKHTIDFPPENVFVIGDTPHDVQCGKAIGAKTIAVATGAYPIETLEACQPTAVFADFRHPEKFFELLK
ncbi:MAG: HAD hydrolase-like protein [Verrucomicrobiota bacterium]|nr:HAD hydrolase-like protein [Verrucomicrobiota bacterium]